MFPFCSLFVAVQFRGASFLLCDRGVSFSLRRHDDRRQGRTELCERNIDSIRCAVILVNYCARGLTHQACRSCFSIKDERLWQRYSTLHQITNFSRKFHIDLNQIRFQKPFAISETCHARSPVCSHGLAEQYSERVSCQGTSGLGHHYLSKSLSACINSSSQCNNTIFTFHGTGFSISQLQG
jgi:hypothetical protein